MSDLFTAAGVMGGVIASLGGAGYLLSRARRERDWGEAIGSLRTQVADLAEDLAALRYDFDALQWSVRQRPPEVAGPIFEDARRYRQRDRRDKTDAN